MWVHSWDMVNLGETRMVRPPGLWATVVETVAESVMSSSLRLLREDNSLERLSSVDGTI